MADTLTLWKTKTTSTTQTATTLRATLTPTTGATTTKATSSGDPSAIGNPSGNINQNPHLLNINPTGHAVPAPA